MISDMCRIEKAGHTPCANFTNITCVLHKPSTKSHKSNLSGVVLVQFRTVMQNQLNSANVPLFWPAASHPVMLQTTVLHTLLTTHSAAHADILKLRKHTHIACSVRHELRSPAVTKIILKPCTAPLRPFQD